ncbi:MAG: PEP-CTERM sorting domain-containing protein [Planctomycetota bacterium]
MHATRPLAGALIAAGLTAAAQADVITFGSIVGTISDFDGPTTEGNFTYSTVLGSTLFIGPTTDAPGDTDSAIRAQGASSGGTLEITAAPGAAFTTFTFESIDLLPPGFGSLDVTITGLLNGVPVTPATAFSVFDTSPPQTVAATAFNLLGIEIDTLRIFLPASGDDAVLSAAPLSIGGGAEVLAVPFDSVVIADNVVLTPIPEPASLALLALGAATALTRRPRPV